MSASTSSLTSLSFGLCTALVECERQLSKRLTRPIESTKLLDLFQKRIPNALAALDEIVTKTPSLSEKRQIVLATISDWMKELTDQTQREEGSIIIDEVLLKEAGIMKIPVELFGNIFKFLDGESLGVVSEVHGLWKALIQSRFFGPSHPVTKRFVMEQMKTNLASPGIEIHLSADERRLSVVVYSNEGLEQLLRFPFISSLSSIAVFNPSPSNLAALCETLSSSPNQLDTLLIGHPVFNSACIEQLTNLLAVKQDNPFKLFVHNAEGIEEKDSWDDSRGLENLQGYLSSFSSPTCLVDFIDDPLDLSRYFGVSGRVVDLPMFCEDLLSGTHADTIQRDFLTLSLNDQNEILWMIAQAQRWVMIASEAHARALDLFRRDPFHPAVIAASCQKLSAKAAELRSEDPLRVKAALITVP
jgi:hypothetical protein